MKKNSTSDILGRPHSKLFSIPLLLSLQNKPEEIKFLLPWQQNQRKLKKPHCPAKEAQEVIYQSYHIYNHTTNRCREVEGLSISGALK